MTIAGSVPVAVAGTVNANGVASGVFEKTIVTNKQYVTKLTFVNQVVSLVKGSSAGFVGIELYDFGKGYLAYKGANVALQATQNDTNLSAGLSVLMGTVTGTDAATPGTNEKSLLIVTASTAGTYGTKGDAITLDARTAAVASATGGAQNLDGTSSAIKLFLNLNETLADQSATSSLTLNGTVEIHYEDLGADL